MTPKQAKERAEVMLAYAEGRAIQSRLTWSDSWKDNSNPAFDPALEYRVKPETKTGWINIYKYGTVTEAGCVYDTKEIAVKERDPTRECLSCIEITYTPGEGL